MEENNFSIETTLTEDGIVLEIFKDGDYIYLDVDETRKLKNMFKIWECK